jgi:cytoskeletal protein RodZ
MDEPKPPQREDDYVESDRDRRVANISLLVFFVVLVSAGIWLVNAMFEQRQLDECMARGRTNCAPPIEVPAR